VQSGLPAEQACTRGDRGGIVLAVVILVFVAAVIIGSLLFMSSGDLKQTRMALDYQRACSFAESGLDYGVMELRDVIIQYRLSPSVTTGELQNVLGLISPPAAPDPPYAYSTPSGASAFRIAVDSPIVNGTVTNGTHHGSDGSFQYFSITCGCINTNTGQGAVLRQQVQALSLYVIRFGVFYEEDLEILPGPTMTFAGRVHSNGDMYLGGPLSFYDRVTAHGDVFHRRKDNPGSRPGEAKIEDTFGALLTMKIGGPHTFLDSDHPEWMAESLLRWQGNIMSDSHGVARLAPPISPLDAPHDIIERPLTTNDAAYQVATELEKFSNKAALRIHVDASNNVTVTDIHTNDLSAQFSNAVLATSGTFGGRPLYSKNADYQYQMTTPGAYDVTETNFFDAREQAYMAPVDIYVDQLLNDFPELYDGTYSDDQGRGIVYVTRDAPVVGDTNVITCVRVRNGQTIVPNLGLTIATDRPAYVEGNFNTNGVKPALVAGDAVTLLSEVWQDARSMASQNDRTPEDTEYNLVVMTGNYETEVGTYNGGLENVLRFLEHWSRSPRRTVKFRGSIIDLWEAEEVDGLWDYCNGPTSVGVPFRYTAPTRDWGYDLIYLTQNPPGMTKVFGMEEILWERVTWGTVGW